MKPPQTLETERLLLRKPTDKDVVSIFEQYAQDSEVTKYVSWQPHKSIKETEDYINRCILVWADNSAFPVTVPELYTNIGVSVSIRVCGNRDGADRPNRLARQASVR
ncbi:GNAT family N-acetyltransferase [Myxosarcina sp. GI1(2024)]